MSYSLPSAFSNFKDKSMPIKNQLPTLFKLYSIYEEISEDLLDEIDVDSYFCHSILNITQKENRLVRLSKTSSKKSFNFKVFKFDCSTIQQKSSLSEEIILTRRELGVVLGCLNDFLLQYLAAGQFNYYSSPTPKAPTSYTFLTDDLFCQHIHEIGEHSKRHLRLSFGLELNKDWIFSFRKFTLTGSEFLLEEITDLRQSEKKASNLIENLLDPRVFSREFHCSFDWLILFSSRNFLLNSFHTEFISQFVPIQNNFHFPIFLSRCPTLLNMISSVSNNNMK